MEVSFIRKLNKHERQLGLLAMNAADFPAASAAGRKIAALKAEVEKFKYLAARQLSGTDNSKMHTDNIDNAFVRLNRLLRRINRAARAVGDETLHLEAKFRLPRQRSQQNLIATARSYYTDSEDYHATFVEYGLGETFRAELLDLIEKIETTKTAVNRAVVTRAEATGGLRESIRLQSRLSDQLDNLVRNHYENNPAMLAAWDIASHLEQPPKSNRRARKEEPAGVNG